MTNLDLGYSDFFETERKKIGSGGSSVARVTAEHRGAYTAVNQDGEFLAKVTGKRMFGSDSREDYPAVGDWVIIEDLNGGQAVIKDILPRRTMISRKRGDKTRTAGKTEVQMIGANIDVAFIVQSIGRDYSLNRFERYIALLADGGVRPAIILNKADVASKEELEKMVGEIKKRFEGVDVTLTSALDGSGLDELRSKIEKGKTYCFLGSSGVGKSSLINALLGGDRLKTGDISQSAGRGKHVTTKREMYFMENGGIVIDNPGMREVGTEDAEAGIKSAFEEIEALAVGCRFPDCSHGNEPGCAVRAALEAGALDAEKHSNYIRLKKEAEYSEMTDLEKRRKDRQFGKFVKSVKKQLKDKEL